ncbi:MAG: NAD(P)/FAD-dependent oxidoreductase [Candidatus Marinimicrobia bacterium]|nr:NAD(P)/FAD-dependent oxidoreductase [Candidatus Neomarinimicrobiota bacterium]
MSDSYNFDAIIIGAGIVGLAVADKLREKFDSILLVEKENSYGKHVSSRNSEVIHSGIYYDRDSLKAKLCVEGNKKLVQFAKSNNINHKICGKLVVISDTKELQRLEILMHNGKQNGVVGLEILSANEVNKREPHIQSEGALWVPSAGIIDSHGVMQKLEYKLKSQDGVVVYNSEVTGIQCKNDNYSVSFNDLDYSATSPIVINSAGLWCDKISSMLGITDYKLHICKGEYYRTSLYRNQINSLIYPLPTDISLGIHIVLHLDGSISFGPNAYYVDKIDYHMDDSNKAFYLEHINHYLKLDEANLSEDFTGIRPKIQAPGEPAQDFIICNESDKGYNNFINLIGIESPGLTSSLAIADYVQSIIN